MKFACNSKPNSCIHSRIQKSFSTDTLQNFFGSRFLGFLKTGWHRGGIVQRNPVIKSSNKSILANARECLRIFAFSKNWNFCISVFIKKDIFYLNFLANSILWMKIPATYAIHFCIVFSKNLLEFKISVSF